MNRLLQLKSIRQKNQVVAFPAQGGSKFVHALDCLETMFPLVHGCDPLWIFEDTGEERSLGRVGENCRWPVSG